MMTTLLSTAALLAVAVVTTSTGPVIAGQNKNDKADKDAAVDPNTLKTKYPIKHLVVVFNENESFDHYFGTYPNALNPEGEPVFEPARNTQRDINNLLSNPSLLDNNPNLNSANGTAPLTRSALIARRPTPSTRAIPTRTSRRPSTAARTTSSR